MNWWHFTLKGQGHCYLNISYKGLIAYNNELLTYFTQKVKGHCRSEIMMCFFGLFFNTITQEQNGDSDYCSWFVGQWIGGHTQPVTTSRFLAIIFHIHWLWWQWLNINERREYKNPSLHSNQGRVYRFSQYMYENPSLISCQQCIFTGKGTVMVRIIFLSIPRNLSNKKINNLSRSSPNTQRLVTSSPSTTFNPSVSVDQRNN